jgi:hypothetical protein
MNTRASGSPRHRHPAPALLLVVAALAFPGAPAGAGCGSHDDRPALPLGWSMAEAPTGRPAVPDRMPTCSGLNCSRTPSPPIASMPGPPPRPDLCGATTPGPEPGHRVNESAGQSEALRPIGRETDVERPPCGPASIG